VEIAQYWRAVPDTRRLARPSLRPGGRDGAIGPAGSAGRRAGEIYRARDPSYIGSLVRLGRVTDDVNVTVDHQGDHMPHYLAGKELRNTAPADRAAFRGPIPTQVISNGELTPIPQTRDQARVEQRVKELASDLAPRHGMSRRSFLASSAGMAAGFLAMNEVFGPLFEVDRAEAVERCAAQERSTGLANQFIFDLQTHFVHDNYSWQDLKGFGKYAKEHCWNPDIADVDTLTRYKFGNYFKEVYLDSDTKMAVLSGAPSDHPDRAALENDQIHDARRRVNAFAGSRRMLSHAVVKPTRDDDSWLRKVDQEISTLRPDSWKLYTTGDPLPANTSKSPYWLDDEKLMYPFYERIRKAGITTVCVHKGVLPASYATELKDVWKYATVRDVLKAARDFPDLTFIIYHAAARPILEDPADALREFEQDGRIKWSSDLADIPAQLTTKNVYAEIGTAFANCATSNPRFAAALLGVLIKGMGIDHVLWGTDSVWYGSPQWQIEAMRRLKMPDDLKQKYGFPDLGDANSSLKQAIFGLNAAKLYGITPRTALAEVDADGLTAMKAEYLANGGQRSNLRYGYVARKRGLRV
jgi:predicted TIM-barrel fold metal-dependent hydrolase